MARKRKTNDPKVIANLADAAAAWANRHWGQLDMLDDEDRDEWHRACSSYAAGLRDGFARGGILAPRLHSVERGEPV
jgi:hypothetical protein